MGLWSETAEKLGKLRRNELQMSPAQKIQYKEQIGRFKICIFTSAMKILAEFIRDGLRVQKDDLEYKTLLDEIGRIMEEECKAGELKRLQRVLFTTYSLDRFLEESFRWRDRIRYEAYGPYWLSHVTETGDPDYPYHNDLIDKDWWRRCNEWVATKMEGGKRATDYQGGLMVMLPPTKELLEKRYAEERKTE